MSLSPNRSQGRTGTLRIPGSGPEPSSRSRRTERFHPPVDASKPRGRGPITTQPMSGDPVPPQETAPTNAGPPSTGRTATLTKESTSDCVSSLGSHASTEESPRPDAPSSSAAHVGSIGATKVRDLSVRALWATLLLGIGIGIVIGFLAGAVLYRGDHGDGQSPVGHRATREPNAVPPPLPTGRDEEESTPRALASAPPEAPPAPTATVELDPGTRGRPCSAGTSSRRRAGIITSRRPGCAT